VKDGVLWLEDCVRCARGCEERRGVPRERWNRCIEGVVDSCRIASRGVRGELGLEIYLQMRVLTFGVGYFIGSRKTLVTTMVVESSCISTMG
jgi:hypothetical protein